MKVSVVVVSYRRLERLPEILAAWLKEAPDVWLCDCSRPGAKGIPAGVKVVRFTPDPGNKVRHAVALLTEGDLVIKADDDIMPKPGLVADFVKAHAEVGPAILSIHGRTFHGRDYYRDTRLIGAKSVHSSLRVDFVGVITCAPRELLSMDLRGCATEVEDLFWQMEKYPKAAKYVIPTDKFVNLPESKDARRLCAPGPARAIRRKYYDFWYVRHYRNPERKA